MSDDIQTCASVIHDFTVTVNYLLRYVFIGSHCCIFFTTTVQKVDFVRCLTMYMFVVLCLTVRVDRAVTSVWSERPPESGELGLSISFYSMLLLKIPNSNMK